MIRKKKATKTRFHVRLQTLKRKHPNIKKKAKKLSNILAREEFFRKYESKTIAHKALIDFFKPRAATKQPKISITKYVSRTLPPPSPTASPTLPPTPSPSPKETRRQLIRRLFQERRKARREAAKAPSDNSDTSTDDPGELWAEAANPAEYADCDKTPSYTSFQDRGNKMEAAAGRDESDQTDQTDQINFTTNSTNSINTNTNLTTNSINTNTNITTDTDNEDDSIIEFNPPEILGPTNKQTTDPNATILE